VTPEARHPLDMAPPAVRALATRHGMGATFQRYEATRCAPIVFYVLAVGMPAFTLSLYVVPLIAYSGSGIPTVLLVFVGALSVGTALGVIGWVQLIVSTTPRRRVYLFESGFVRTNGDHRAREFFWHDISVRRYEDSYEEHYSCTVKRPGGAKMELASPSGYWRAVDVIELGREISRRIAAAQAPRVLAAVRNGRTVRFGRLAVDGNGLRIGLHHIPWNHIVDVKFTGDEVVVHTTHRFLGRRRRPAMAVSNASVLAAVADVLKSAP
jgi:hypothetical protein